MFKTQDYNVFLNQIKELSPLTIEDIDSFFKIGVLHLFFNFPDCYQQYIYDKKSQSFIIPEKITLIHEFNILNYFIKFCLSNQLEISILPYSLLAQSKLGYSLFFSTGSSYDNEYGDILFLINFNKTHFTKYDILLLNKEELIQYEKYLYSNLHNIFFQGTSVITSIFLQFRIGEKLNYNDQQYNKINNNIKLMLKEYKKLRKEITPTTEHFFERGLLEQKIKDF